MRYDTPRQRSRVRFLVVRRQIPLPLCRRPADADEHAGSEIVSGPVLASQGIAGYRLHAVGSLVTTLLLDAGARFCGAVTLELPESRRQGVWIRYLVGFHLWEAFVGPDRFELDRDRDRGCVLGRDPATGLWIAEAPGADLLQEAAGPLALLAALLEDLDAQGVIDAG